MVIRHGQADHKIGGCGLLYWRVQEKVKHISNQTLENSEEYWESNGAFKHCAFSPVAAMTIRVAKTLPSEVGRCRVSALLHSGSVALAGYEGSCNLPSNE